MLVSVRQGVPRGCLLAYHMSTLLATHIENVSLPHPPILVRIRLVSIPLTASV